MTGPVRPSPRCRALFEQLSRYLDGDLPPARRRIVEKHMASCACCAMMSRRLRLTLAACRAEARRRPPRAVMARAAERVRALLKRNRVSL